MFRAWGALAYRYRVIIPLIMVGFILLLHVGAGTSLDQRMSQEGWEDPGADSTVAARVEQETFGRDNRGDVIALFTAADGTRLDSPEVSAALTRSLDGLAERHPDAIDRVIAGYPQQLSEDGRRAFAALPLVGDGEQTLKDFRAIEDDLRALPLPEGVTLSVAGATAVADALDEGMTHDIRRAEVIALPVVGVLLLIVFGSVIAAFMPLIVGILSIMGALGILSFIAAFTQVNVFSQSVVTLLGLGLAIDYGLFMVSRFREELDRGEPVERAVTTTTATAGQTVVFSAAMVAVALSGLLIFPQAFLKSIAYGAMAAVGLAALLSVTILPSLLGMLGPNIDRLTVRRTDRRRKGLRDTIWWRLPAWAMRRSGLVVTLVAGLLVALTLPLANIQLGGINENFLPPTDETRLAQAEFDEAFPGFRTDPVKIVVAGADTAELAGIYRQANDIAGLTGNFTPVNPTEEGTTVLAAGIASREDKSDVIAGLRAIEEPDGVEILVGGTPALEVESIEALLDKLPWMLLYMVAVTFVLMSLVFGSLVIPLKAILMTFLGLGATVGLLTLIFVDGLGSGLLHVSPGPLMSPVVVLIIAIVYGLSTDYEVFLVSRMVEARSHGARTDDAITYGTANTGSIITAAALIMIVVAGAFGFSDIAMMKYIACGMIAALLFDATIIRMLLVPSVMHVLGTDNWWAPRIVKRAYFSLGLGEHHPAFRRPAIPTGGGARGGQRRGLAGDDPADAPRQGPAAPAQSTLPISAATPTPADEAARGGRTTTQDHGLVPFNDLVHRLEDRR